MEKRHFVNEETGEPSEMSVEFDLSTGIVRTCCSGFWSVRQVNAFFTDWRMIIRHIHDAGLAVSALVDMSASGVQKAEVAEIIASVTADMYRDGDAIAMLVPTSLAKMQMRRVLDARYHGFFLSRNAAETWLSAKATAGAPGHRTGPVRQAG